MCWLHIFFGIGLHCKICIPQIQIKSFHLSQVAAGQQLCNAADKEGAQKTGLGKTLDGQFYFIAVKNLKLAMK